LSISGFIKVQLFTISLFVSTGCFSATTFTPASQPTGWLSRPSLSNNNLLSNAEVIYQLNYDKNSWRGDILAKYINNQAVVASNGPWDPNTAGLLLDAVNYDTGRKIVTRNGSVNIAFRWANLSATQQTSMGDATTGPKRLNFVRGDRSNEEPSGALYRTRDSVLGDILHSPLVVWKQDLSTQRLFVGANDGMLHVFNTANGQEVFAYIPSMLITNLKNLSTKPYVHTYFVDGGIALANVDFSGVIKTVLVGSLGAGGKGLYALDVTNTTAVDEASAASKIKWEITNASTGYTALGYTYGSPRIGRLNDGTAVAIVGNGYLNTSNGHAILYLINLDTGVLIKAIDTGSGTVSSPNGLSTPTLFDSNGDGKVDLVYAGDIDGHLWKFNLSGTTPSLYAVLDNSGGTKALLTTSPLQAITTAPVVMTHPSGVGSIVGFATGRFLTSTDLTDTTQHAVYGVWDGAPSLNTTQLTQTLTVATDSLGKTRIVTANVPNWTSGTGHHNSWKVLLPAGEQVTGEFPFESNGRFYFMASNPTTVNAVLPNGASWLYELQMSSGGSPDSLIFDLNNDGLFNALDLATACTPTALVSCIPVAKLLGAGVFSQATAVEASGFDTLLFTNHPDTAFGAGYTIKSVVSTVNGRIKTTVTTYSNNATYTRVEETLSNGLKTITQTYRNGTTVVTTVSAGNASQAVISSSPEEATSLDKFGRQSWWEIFQ